LGILIRFARLSRIVNSYLTADISFADFFEDNVDKFSDKEGLVFLLFSDVVIIIELVDVLGCRAGTILGSLPSKYSSLTRRDHHHRLLPRMINTFNKGYKYKEVLMVQANRFTTQA
jgi:hypothetical protein